MTGEEIRFWELLIGFGSGAVMVVAKAVVRILYTRTLERQALAGNKEAAAKLLALGPPDVVGSGPTMVLMFVLAGVFGDQVAAARQLAAAPALAHQQTEEPGDNRDEALWRWPDVILPETRLR